MSQDVAMDGLALVAGIVLTLIMLDNRISRPRLLVCMTVNGSRKTKYTRLFARVEIPDELIAAILMRKHVQPDWKIKIV